VTVLVRSVGVLNDDTIICLATRPSASEENGVNRVQLDLNAENQRSEKLIGDATVGEL